MHDFLILHQAGFRLGLFIALLGTMMLSELFFSRRLSNVSKRKRWATNVAIVLTDVVVLRLLFPITAVETAMMIRDQGIGLLNNIDMLMPAKILVAVLLLDLLIYLQQTMISLVETFQ